MIERRLVDNIIDNAGPICHTCAPTIFRNLHAFSLLCMQISSPRTPWHALFSKLFYHASFCVLNICAGKMSYEMRKKKHVMFIAVCCLYQFDLICLVLYENSFFYSFMISCGKIFEKLICMRMRDKKLQLWRLMRAGSPAYWVVMHGSALFPWRRL